MESRGRDGGAFVEGACGIFRRVCYSPLIKVTKATAGRVSGA